MFLCALVLNDPGPVPAMWHVAQTKESHGVGWTKLITMNLYLGAICVFLSKVSPLQELAMVPWTEAMNTTTTLTVTAGCLRPQRDFGPQLTRERRAFAGSWSTSLWVLVINIMPRVASLSSWVCSCSRSSSSQLRYNPCVCLLSKSHSFFLNLTTLRK